MISLENYKKEKLTIDLVKANLFGLIVMIPIILVYGIPFYLIHVKNSASFNITEILESIKPIAIFGYSALFFIVFIVGVILHELIHGITWAIFAKQGFKSIKFGVIWKMLTPYCHCKEPLSVKHYMLGAIMPAIVLGFIPAIYGLVFGDFVILIFGAFFTLAAAGDFLIINLIRKENWNSLVQDHPSEVGCYIYRTNI